MPRNLKTPSASTLLLLPQKPCIQKRFARPSDRGVGELALPIALLKYRRCANKVFRTSGAVDAWTTKTSVVYTSKFGLGQLPKCTSRDRHTRLYSFGTKPLCVVCQCLQFLRPRQQRSIASTAHGQAFTIRSATCQCQVAEAAKGAASALETGSVLRYARRGHHLFARHIWESKVPKRTASMQRMDAFMTW